MHDVAWRGMWICVRSKDAQKQLARTSLSGECQQWHDTRCDRRESLDMALVEIAQKLDEVDEDQRARIKFRKKERA